MFHHEYFIYQEIRIVGFHWVKKHVYILMNIWFSKLLPPFITLTIKLPWNLGWSWAKLTSALDRRCYYFICWYAWGSATRILFISLLWILQFFKFLLENRINWSSPDFHNKVCCSQLLILIVALLSSFGIPCKCDFIILTTTEL